MKMNLLKMGLLLMIVNMTINFSYARKGAHIVEKNGKFELYVDGNIERGYRPGKRWFI